MLMAEEVGLLAQLQGVGDKYCNKNKCNEDEDQEGKVGGGRGEDVSNFDRYGELVVPTELDESDDGDCDEVNCSKQVENVREQ